MFRLNNTCIVRSILRKNLNKYKSCQFTSKSFHFMLFFLFLGIYKNKSTHVRIFKKLLENFVEEYIMLNILQAN